MSLGRGVLKGLFVTFKNAITSYTTARGERGGLFTEQYPEERPTLPENFRQFPFLVFDGEDADAGIR